MTKLLKAYGYLRVSSSGQLKGDGFDRQKEVIKKYADKSNIEIIDIYQEDVSGTKGEDEREEFNNMLSAILNNGVRTIVIERLDRLAREYRIQENLVAYLISKDIELISASTEENITQAFCGDPMKRALVQIQGVFAELDKNLLVKRLRTARERIRAEKGKCEGSKSITESNPELCIRLKQLRRKKKGHSPMSYAAIAKTLNAENLFTTSGKEWTGNNVHQRLRNM